MIFKGSYDSAEAVPQEFKDKYTDVDGKFMLTGSIESKDASDFKEVLKLKQSSFDEMHGLKEKVKEAETKAKKALSDYEVLKLQPKEGAVSEEEIQKLVETRVNVRTEALTKENDELKNINTDFKGKLHSGDKSSYLNEIKAELSADYIKQNGFIFDTFLDNAFSRQEDGSHLTNEYNGIPAGLNKAEAIAKLIELNPQLGKQNTASHGGGSDGNNANTGNRGKFDELLKKQTGGESLSRQESVELSTLANQLKNEE
jgi:hypothetical protein